VARALQRLALEAAPMVTDPRIETPPDADQDPPDPEVLATLARDGRGPGRWIALIIAVALLAALGGYLAWPRGDPAAGWEQRPAVRGDLPLTVTAVGKLDPVDSVQVGSDLSGRLIEVVVRANDRVAAGQVIARLDPEPFDNAVVQAEAQLASARAVVVQAQANLTAAERDIDQLGRLVAQGAATRAELERAQTAVEVGRANLRGARAQRDQAAAARDRAGDNLRHSAIVAPIAGVVARRYVDPGQTVVSAMQATPLFDIASDLGQMLAKVGVDEADIGRVAAGQAARFTVSAWPEREFRARVFSVDLAPDPAQAVVTYDAELRLENADLALRPGMTATASIEVGRVDGALLVPAQALRFTPRGATPPAEPSVWRLRGRTAEPVAVHILGSDGSTTAIEADALTAGDLVIVGGSGR
jgi:HlyD family secretion protein